MVHRFIHLSVRTSYSLLESMITPKALLNWGVEHSVPAIGITDHNNLFGALELSELLSGAGIQPIMGCQFAVATPERDSPSYRLSLYAQDEQGWSRLMHLSSLAYLESEDGVPILKEEHIFTETGGLIVLTGGADGAAGIALSRGQRDAAKAYLERFECAYPGRTYVELQRHNRPEELETEPLLLELAYELDLPVVATQDARFLSEANHPQHDALLCIRNGAYLGQDDRPKASSEQFLKSPDQMVELFHDLPEAIENTLEIAKRCAIRPKPRKPILPTFDSRAGRNELEELGVQAKDGLEQRLSEAAQLYGDRQDYFDRLEYELNIIGKMGFPGYFLIVSDFIKWAKLQGIPVGPGRGSGAGSLVAWSLLITDLDPLRFGLLFERFLNPERVSMPDFDVDFCQERRGEVIRYVRDKYGAENVSSIITFGTLQAKAVVRDVGRVMQMPFGQVDRLAKLIPFNPANPPKLSEAIEGEPKFKDEVAKDARVGELLDTALALEGLYRNAGTHAAGVVIADRPLVQLAPLYRDPRSDLPASQYNMKWAEISGLVKFDFLGLKTLTVIERAMGFLDQQGKAIEGGWDTFDDQATYDLMASGETLGVFQLEGQGMRDTLKRVKPGNIEDVIAIISLYRPGPMDNIPTFCEGKEDASRINYPHPLTEPILKETYGVPVYQEQVMRMAQDLAGYSLGEADLLRRAMGKKKKEEMDKQRARFIEGAAHRDIQEAKANEIFDIMAKFAGYGFNKSHAAAYAVISYQTAFLKAHFPVEFLAASMSLDIQNTDKLAAFVQEAKRLEIEVSPPDVNTSSADFNVDGDRILYALGAIKGVGLDAMQHLVDIRDAGKFVDLYDLAERVDPKHVNKKCFEALSRAGGFDGLESNRARALEASPMLAAMAVSAADERGSNQVSLFGDASETLRSPMPKARAWGATEKLDNEFKSVGFFLSGHPLDDLLSGKARDRVVLAAEREEAALEKSFFDMIGLVRARNERNAMNGGKFAYLTLSDPTGEFEVMVPPETLMQVRDLIEPGATVVCRVKARLRDEELRLSLDGAVPLEKAILGAPSGLTVRVGRDVNLDSLNGIARKLQDLQTPERGVLHLEVLLENGSAVTIKLPGTYAVGVAAAQALKSAPGVDTVAPLAA